MTTTPTTPADRMRAFLDRHGDGLLLALAGWADGEQDRLRELLTADPGPAESDAQVMRTDYALLSTIRVAACDVVSDRHQLAGWMDAEFDRFDAAAVAAMDAGATEADAWSGQPSWAQVLRAAYTATVGPVPDPPADWESTTAALAGRDPGTLGTTAAQLAVARRTR